MKAAVDALVQVTLYSAAVTAGILLFRFIFKNRISSKLQYLMWWLLILRLLLPVTPDVGLHLSLRDVLLKQAQQAELPAPAPVSDAAPASLPGGQPSYESVAPAVQPDTDAAPSQRVDPAKSADRYSVVFTVWLLGAIGFLGWLIFVKLRCYESLQHLMAGGPKAAYELYDRCCVELNVKPLPLWIVNKPMSPGIAFFGEPVLLIPLSLCGDESRLRFALLHELTHKKRGDHYVTLLLNILRAVYWFNPVVHFAFSELRADMESACDSDVLARIGREQKRSYLTVILDMFSYDAEPILGMSQIRSKRMAKRRVEGAFMRNRTSPAFRAITLCIAMVMSLCCFTAACQKAPVNDDPSEVSEPMDAETDAADGFAERAAMESLQRAGAIKHLNYFSEPPRGEGGFAAQHTGDFDGDGTEDRAYLKEDGNYRKAIVELADGTIDISPEGVMAGSDFYAGSDFFIDGADLTGDGVNEIVLLIDTGGNGGHGSYSFIILQRAGSGWRPMDGVPIYGVNAAITWQDNVCKIVSGSYCESVADGCMMRRHYEQTGSGDIWSTVDGIEYSGDYAADGPCDIAVIREQGRCKVVITQYVTGPTGAHADQLGYMDTKFAFDEDGGCDIEDKYFVLFPYEAEKASDAHPGSEAEGFDRTDPEQAVAEFLARYFDDMAKGNDDFGFSSSTSTMYDGLLQLQSSDESYKNISLLRQWINFTRALRETSGGAMDRGKFQYLSAVPRPIEKAPGGIKYDFIYSGSFKTTAMGSYVEAGLVKNGDSYQITYVDFPDDKEYQNFCADLEAYMKEHNIDDYMKSTYIEYVAEREGKAAAGEEWQSGVRSVPAANFVPTQFTADIYYGFTIDKFNTTKISSAAESLVSIDSFSRKGRNHILDIMSTPCGVLFADVDLIQHTIDTVDWGDDGELYGGTEYDVEQFFGGNVSGERLVRMYSLGNDAGYQVVHTHYYLLQSAEKGGYDRVITFRFLTATTKAPIAAKNGEWTIYLDDSDCERWLKTLRAEPPANAQSSNQAATDLVAEAKGLK